jgi:hypothetical protein
MCLFKFLKKIFMKKNILSTITLLSALFFACNAPNSDIKKVANVVNSAQPTAAQTAANANDFNTYWYAGKAELSAYELKINRYDQVRKGYVAIVFVTEDVSKSKHVKLDDPAKAGDDRVPVLKINTLSRFQTGIYDYSMMSSLFTPVDIQKMPHSLKATTTVQDWCGHIFTQLDYQKGNQYKVNQFSYFESEGDKVFNTEGVLLEDEIFTRLRINPSSLPEKALIIPNLTFTRLRHKPITASNATITFKDTKGKDRADKDVEKDLRICTVNYPDLKRRLEVTFEAAFPYKIVEFVEFDGDKEMSHATVLKTMMSDYWNKHDNQSAYLREMLGL